MWLPYFLNYIPERLLTSGVCGPSIDMKMVFINIIIACTYAVSIHSSQCLFKGQHLLFIQSSLHPQCTNEAGIYSQEALFKEIWKMCMVIRSEWHTCMHLSYWQCAMQYFNEPHIHKQLRVQRLNLEPIAMVNSCPISLMESLPSGCLCHRWIHSCLCEFLELLSHKLRKVVFLCKVTFTHVFSWYT